MAVSPLSVCTCAERVVYLFLSIIFCSSTVPKRLPLQSRWFFSSAFFLTFYSSPPPFLIRARTVQAVTRARAATAAATRAAAAADSKWAVTAATAAISSSSRGSRSLAATKVSAVRAVDLVRSRPSWCCFGVVVLDEVVPSPQNLQLR